MHRIIFLICLFVFSAVARAAETPVPLLWKVSDQDNAVYLLGSFHMLKESDYPLSSDIDTAFADSAEVLFEMHPDAMSDSAMVGQKLMQAGMFDDGRNLASVLPPQTMQLLSDYLAAKGIPVQGMLLFRPWFVMMTVTVLEYQASGVRPDLGLDMHFVKRVKAAGIASGGLESIDDQVAVFAGLSEEVAVASLQEFLQDTPGAMQEMQALHAQWRRGDAEGLLHQITESREKMSADFYGALQTERNLKWLPQIRERLDARSDRNTLIVVGAMHLLGDDGLIKMLGDSGYRIERICSQCRPAGVNAGLSSP